MLNHSRDIKKCKAGTVVGGWWGRRSMLCDPGSELRLGREQEKRKANIIDGISSTRNREFLCWIRLQF